MMKILILFSLVFVLTFFYACDSSVNNNDEVVINSKGTIVTDSVRICGYYLIKSDEPYLGTTILFPSNLPNSLKQEGVRVLFSGQLIKCPLNANCVALEINLSFISKL